MQKISDWPDQKSHSILHENLTNTVLLDYRELPKTSSQNSSAEAEEKEQEQEKLKKGPKVPEIAEIVVI